MRLVPLFLGALAAAEASGYCAMYDDCGKKSVFGQSLPCAVPQPPVVADNDTAQLIKQICGADFDTSSVCCSSSQVASMAKNLKRVDAILQSCPACHQNFYDFICEFTCSPQQASFIHVTKTEHAIDTKLEIVTELDQYVNPKYAQAFYSSCKDVKFGATNGRAMDLVGGGAKNYSQFLKFLGDEKPLLGGSPFQINFIYENEANYTCRGTKKDMRKCSDPDWRCACSDCPKSCPKLPGFHNFRNYCTVGSIPCFSLAVGVTWACLLFLLLGYHVHLKKQMMFDEMDDESDDVLIQPGDNKLTKWFNQRQQTIMNTLESGFRKLGTYCAQNPLRVIMVNIVACAILMVGLINLQLETDPIKLWVSENEPELWNKRNFESSFGEWFRIEQIIVSSNDSKPVLDWDVVTWWFEKEKELVLMGGFEQDLCFKPLGETCAVESFTQWFGGDINYLSNTTWARDLLKCANSPMECLPSFQQPLKPSLLFDNDDPTKASAFTVTLLVNSNSSRKGYTAEAQSFEYNMIDWVRKLNHPRLDIAYSTEVSLETELNKSSNTDVRIIVFSYLAMFVYVALALGGKLPTTPKDFVHTRISLALSAIIVIVISVLSSAGVMSYFGVKSTLIIAEVIPFLILAVGIDNVFLLVGELDQVNTVFPHDSLSQRISTMLARVGPSCLGSAIIQTLLFVLCTAVDMPAVRNFAIYSAGAVAINFVLQMTGLVSLISLDQKRIEDNRIDGAWWIQIPGIQLNDRDEGDKETWSLQKWIKRIYAPWLLNRTHKPKIATIFVLLLGVSLSLLPNIELGLDQRLAIPADSYLVPYFNAVYKHFNEGPPMFVVVQGADITNRTIQEQYCGKFSACDEYSVANILQMEYARGKKSTISQPSTSWLDDFFGWLNPNLDECCRVRKNDPTQFCAPHAPPRQCQVCFKEKPYDSFLNGLPEGQEFMTYFNEWISAPSDPCPLGGKAPYATSIEWNATSIASSYFRTAHQPLRSQEDFIIAHKNAKRIVDEIKHFNPDLDVYAFSPFYVYFVQYDTIVELTLMLLAASMAVVWLVSCGILGSFRSASVMVIVVISILVNVGGAMAILGISLNAVSLVNLVISAGLAVEFCIHITRAYVTSVVYDTDEASLFNDLVATGIIDDPQSPGGSQLKAYQSLATVGSSVISGITLTKLIGIGVLAWTRSQIFDVYYFRMWASLIMIASVHALVLLPVLLSFFGDSTKPKYTVVG